MDIEIRRDANDGTFRVDDLLRVEEVARLTRMSRSKVYSMFAARELPFVRLGGMLRIPAASLRKLIAECTVGIGE